MVFWYLAVWWPSAVYDWKEIRNETPNGELLLMMPYDAKEQHFPWSSSALSTLSGACGNPISSSSPHTQTDTQANTSINTQRQLQVQTHKHKHTSINTQTITGTKTQAYTSTNIQANISTNAQANYHTQAPIHANKIDKFIPLVHYNDQDTRLIDMCQCQSETSVWMRRIRKRAKGWWE